MLRQNAEDEADAAEAARMRNTAEQIERIFIARMTVQPMLVGKLLFMAANESMVQKAAGAVAVATFSAIVRVGLAID